MYSYENTYQKGAHSYQFTELSFKRKKRIRQYELLFTILKQSVTN